MNKFPESCWVLYIISHYESTLEITEIQNPMKGVILVAEIYAVDVIGVKSLKLRVEMQFSHNNVILSEFIPIMKGKI